MAWARKHDVRVLDALVRQIIDGRTSAAEACRLLAAGRLDGVAGSHVVPPEYARSLVSAERRRRATARRLEGDAAGVLEDAAQRLAAIAAMEVDALQTKRRKQRPPAAEVAAAARSIREAASALQAARAVRPRGLTGAQPAPDEQPRGLVDSLAAEG